MIWYWIFQLIVNLSEIRCDFLLQISVTENKVYPSPIVNLEQVLKEKKIIPDDKINKHKIYAISDKSSAFSLTDNKLYISSKVDREAICPDSRSDQASDLSKNSNRQLTRTSCRLDECCTVFSFQVDLEYRISSYFILIKIIDQNDNIPKFVQFSNPYLVLLENVPVNSIIQLPEAIDYDSELFGIKRYSISKPFLVGNSSHFAIMDKMIFGRPQMMLMNVLDREVTPEYRFILKAIDRETDDLRDNNGVEVEIKIGDVNDNAPTFDKTFYTASITEHSKLMNIISFYITDHDEGSNREVSVSIETENEISKSQIKQFFQVEYSSSSMSGSIRLIDEIDYETQNSRYSFSIVAKDNGRPSLSSSSKVTILILNKNDHAPLIKVIRKGEIISRSIMIYENEPPKTIIASLQVSDQDSNIGEIDCIIDDNISSFEISLITEPHPLGLYKEFIISTLRSLDREDENNQYLTIKIRCSDNDKFNPLNTNITIIINLHDINDNPPVFSRLKYQGELMENLPQSVVKMIEPIQTTDKDQGKNAQVTFKLDTSINSSDWHYFIVDPNSGKIFSKTSIDYEKNKLFTFNIIAMDKDQSNLSSTALIIVHIIDTNDNAPVFAKPHYTFNVRENVPINTFIGEIESSDLDTKPENKIVRYFHKSNIISYPVIHIDQSSGKIRTIAPIDREKIRTLSILVTARNEANYQFNNVNDPECMVVITIEDENDNPPVFSLINPSKSSLSFYINKGYTDENCHQIPYAVSDADHFESNIENCCTLQIENDYNGIFYLNSKMPNFLCLLSSVNTPSTYRITLTATDNKNNANKVLKAKVSFNIFIKNEIIENPVSERNENKISNSKTQYSQHSKFSLIIIIIVVVIVCVLIVTFVLLVFYRYLAFNTEDNSNIYDNNVESLNVQSMDKNATQIKYFPNNNYQKSIWLPDELRLLPSYNSELKDNSTWSRTLKKNEWINEKSQCPNQVQDAYQLINSSVQVLNRSPNVGYEALCLVTSSGHEYFSVDGKEINSTNMLPLASKSTESSVSIAIPNYKENDMKYCQTSFV